MGFKILGVKKVIKDFAGMVDRMENPEKAFKIIGEKGRKDVNDHFVNTQGPSGQWRKLAHPREMRAGQGKGEDKVLQDTGALRMSIKKKVSKDKAIVFTRKKYAAIHNYGGRVPDRFPKDKNSYLMFKVGGKFVKTKKAKGFNMTARPFMWFSNKAIDSMALTLAKFIVKNQKR